MKKLQTIQLSNWFYFKVHTALYPFAFMAGNSAQKHKKMHG